MGVSYSDSENTGSDSFVGDILSLFSAVCYATYVVLLKKMIRNETRINMRRFFGFVGLFNFYCCGHF